MGFGDLPPILDDLDTGSFVPGWLASDPWFDVPPIMPRTTVVGGTGIGVGGSVLGSSFPSPQTNAGGGNTLTNILNTILGATSNIFSPSRPVTSLYGSTNTTTPVRTSTAPTATQNPSGISLSTTTLVIIGVVALAFLTGKKR